MATIYTKDSYQHDMPAIDALKKTLSDGLVKTDGEIWIIPNVSLCGKERTTDIDLILMGYIDEYELPSNSKEIKLKSFITTIEIKYHPVSQLGALEGDLVVKYSNSNKEYSVRTQILGQRMATRDFISDAFHKTPDVSPLIWLPNVTTEELSSLELNQTNILSCAFDANMLFEKILGESDTVEQVFDAFHTFTKLEIANLAEALLNTCK